MDFEVRGSIPLLLKITEELRTVDDSVGKALHTQQFLSMASLCYDVINYNDVIMTQLWTNI